MTIQGIGLNEKSHPQSVTYGVQHTNDHSVDNMANKGTKQLCTVCVGPVKRYSLEKRKQCQRTKEPPQQAIPKSPTEARTKTANIALKQEAKRGADDHSKQRVQTNSDCGRRRVHQTRNQ